MMQRKCFFISIIIVMIGLSSQIAYADQKETVTSIQFTQNSNNSEIVVSPKDQLPLSQKQIQSSKKAYEYLPKTGEIIRFSAEIVGAYIISIAVLLFFNRRRKVRRYDT